MKSAIAVLAFLVLPIGQVCAQPGPVPAKQPTYAGKPLMFWVGRLKDEDPLLREEALLALGEFGPAAQEALPAVRALLKADSSWLRLRAATAVWKIEKRSQDVLPILLESLRDENAFRIVVALNTLEQLGLDSIPAAPALVGLLDTYSTPLRSLLTNSLRSMGTAAIPALIGGLTTGKALTRRECLRLLSGFATTKPAAVEAMARCLKDSDCTVRLASARALAQAPGHQDGVARVLNDALKETDPGLRKEALAIVFEVKPRPRELLAAYTMLLDDPVNQVACHAAEAIWDITRDPKRVVPTLTRVLNHPDRNAKFQAINVIYQMGVAGREMLPALINAPNDGVILLRGVVHNVGTAALPELLDALKRSHPQRKQIIEALGWAGPEAVPHLIKLIEEGDAADRAAAVGSIVALGGRVGAKPADVIAVLTKVAKSDDAVERAKAFQALGSLGVKASSAGPLVLEGLKDKDENVRIAAATAVSRFSLPAEMALPPLDAALKSDPSARVRLHAVTVRLKFADDPAPVIPVLLDLLNNRTMQGMAVAKLGQLGPKAKDAVPQLLALVVQEDRKITTANSATIKALVKIAPDDKKVSATFLQLFARKPPMYRFDLLDALAEMGVECDVTPMLADLRSTNSSAFFQTHGALRKLGPKAMGATPLLLEMLRSRTYHERVAAAETLAKVAPQEAALCQKTLLAELGTENKINNEVARALLTIDERDKTALKIFETALASPEAREGALGLLFTANASAKGVLPYLKPLFADREYYIRIAAARAHWKIGGEVEPAVAVLMPILQREELETMHFQALTLLADMGSAAKAVVPILTELAVKARADSELRGRLFLTLEKIDPAAARLTVGP